MRAATCQSGKKFAESRLNNFTARAHSISENTKANRESFREGMVVLGRGRCGRFFFTCCPACFHGCGELRATLRSKTAFFLRSSFLCCCRLGCWRWRGFLAFDLSPPRFGGGGDLCARSGTHRAAACSFLRGSCWARSRAGAAEKLVEFVLEIFNLLVDVDSFLERLK